jgi:hypothetical protein
VRIRQRLQVWIGTPPLVGMDIGTTEGWRGGGHDGWRHQIGLVKTIARGRLHPAA